jgi:hypothetical protein
MRQCLRNSSFTIRADVCGNPFTNKGDLAKARGSRDKSEPAVQGIIQQHEQAWSKHNFGPRLGIYSFVAKICTPIDLIINFHYERGLIFLLLATKSSLHTKRTLRYRRFILDLRKRALVWHD